MFNKNCQKAMDLAKTFAKAAWTTDTIECCLDVQVVLFCPLSSASEPKRFK